MTTTSNDFVPALGRAGNIDRYDRVIALMTRERRWRSALVELIDPQPGERIVDIGCGTGTLAIALWQKAPGALVTGVDPDPAVLAIARAKAAAAPVDWVHAMGDALDDIPHLAGCDRITSSLVLHQCPVAVKSSILRQKWRLLRPGGQMFIADYGEQRSFLMRLLFRQVQMIDGFDLTEPNAKGCLPGLMEDAGFEDVAERAVIPTPTGSISLYSAVKPG
ncbi:MAG: methyltransferase domain-containing protein [Proteobacteria bacterium]|nr:methyltransferase domain-containing protein [Pseudomonadota bacterium]